MRRQRVAQFALCSILCLPALALRRDEKQALREQLSHTVNALATFTDIGRGLESGEPKAISELLAISEAGPSDLAQAEFELVDLRTRVNALQEILDARAVWAGAVSIPPGTVEHSPEGAMADASPAESPGTGAKVAFERAGFVADRARLGRACWRGGRYLEGVAALEPLAGEPQADYWRARCLEKLARNAEALELYTKVIDVAGDSPEGRSAREDSEFLQWSIGHGLVKTP